MPFLPPPHTHIPTTGAKQPAAVAFRRNALFVNPVLYSAGAMGGGHAPSLGSNGSDSEALLYYDDYAQPPAPAAATRPR